MNGLLKNPLGFLAGCLSLALFLPLAVEANNLRVSNVSLTNTLKQAGSTDIKFDLSWENSWRASWTEDDTGAGHDSQTVTNWDAAWVFIKYRLREGANTNWQHAHLASAGHVAPEGITITPGATDGDNVGAFIYRSVNGFGPLNLADLCLRWDYGAQNLKPSDPLDISVQAIEMVYIPEGPFYVGDGRNYGTFNDRAAFETGTSGLPFRITAENYEITLGGGGEDSMGNHNRRGLHQEWYDGFSNTFSVILPADYPKGYHSFYCMKYEITQEQYKNFLNKLTRAQQKALVHAAGTNASYFAMFGTASITNRNGIRCSAEVGEGPIVFGCDFNGNGIFDEEDDGQDLPCNSLNSYRVPAYLAWAGLRPFSELEYEKACRGPKYPVLYEYAWGGTDRTWSTNYVGQDGSGTTTALPTNANHMRWTSSGFLILRAGIFATPTSSRTKAGAGYYGAMELSGSMDESVISLGSAAGRAYNKTAHGAGHLATNGLPNVVTSWPPSFVAGNGWGYRDYSEYSSQVSTRFASGSGSWPHSQGGRGVRTAP